MTDPRQFPPAAQKLNPAGVAAIPTAGTPPEPPAPPSGRPEHVKVSIGLDECVVRAVDVRAGRMCCGRTDRGHLDAAHPGYVETAIRHAEECDASALAGLRRQIADLERQVGEQRERADKAEALLAQAEEYARDLQDNPPDAITCSRCVRMIRPGERFAVNFFGNQATHLACPTTENESTT